MYLKQFEDISAAEIVDSIRKEGCYFTEIALNDSYVEQLLTEVSFDSLLVNHNNVGTVVAGTQKFLTHCLAKSKKAYDLITSEKVLEICNAYFTARYQLTNHRFCQTRQGSHMPWHTDNNLQTDSQLTGKHTMPGLLFLFYLSEQNISPFQYLKASHTWSKQYSHEIYLSNHWVETHHQDAVVSCKMPKGGLIICDTHTIHRAAPFSNRYHARNILLFQVDQVGDAYRGHGEQNLIDTEFIDNLSPEIFSYLGFGVQRNYPAFPNSSAATMPIPDLLELQRQLLPLTLKAIVKSLVKTLLPGELLVNAKRLAWTIKTRK